MTDMKETRSQSLLREIFALLKKEQEEQAGEITQDR